MTLVGVNMRRTMMSFVAVMLLFGTMSVIATQSADAAYPGGNDWIVFENNGDLWVTDGAATVNLTSSANIEADPMFSPDGTKLAFARDVGGNSAIWIANFDPTVPALNVSSSWVQASSGPIDGEPAWSPDGQTIAFERWFNFTVEGVVDGASPTVLTDDAATFQTRGVNPEMTVTNTTDLSSGSIASVDSQTQLTVVALTGGTVNEFSLDDGYSIAVSHSQIYTTPASAANPAGTDLAGLAPEPPYNDREPTWHPDEDLIAFTTTRNGNSDIYTMTSTGGDLANLTDDSVSPFIDQHAIRAAWSPDGSRIVFQSKGSGAVTDENIWTVNKDGSGGALLSTNTGTDNDNEPAWSPDGTTIAFRRSDTGGDRIYVVPSAGGTATALAVPTPPAGSHSAPDWRPALKAVNDTLTVAEGAALAVDVDANDLVPGTVAATVTKQTDPANGSVTLAAGGVFTYTHDGSETTSDSFTYKLTQGAASSIATVAITVTPVNDVPVAVNDSYSINNAGTLTVGAADGVLKNDTDPDDGLSAVLVGDVTNGTLALAANGSFTYVHNGTETLSDSFTYRADDGDAESNLATVSLTIGPINPDPPAATITGPAFGAPGVAAGFGATIKDGSGGPITYAWSITAGGVAVAPPGVGETYGYTPTVTGLHTVTLTVSDSAGADTESMEFRVLNDVSGSIFKGDIVWLANEGITKGCNPPTNDEYCPEQDVTRGQMAAFLVRFLGLTDDGGGNTFIDDNGSVFEVEIAKLAAAGITKGCNPAEGNTRFCPDAPVTREQMAAFLVRALGLTDDGGGNTFVDDDASIFQSEIAKLAEAGITKGCNDAGTEFCPTETVTRGQMAAFLKRASALK